MEILKFVCSFILLSNVNTLFVQPIDDNGTVISPPYNTNATKNIDSLFYYKSPSKENTTKVREKERKNELVAVLKSVFHAASPLQETPGKVEVETDTTSVKSSFHSESSSKETPKKVEVETDTMSVKSSFHSVSSSKETPKKVEVETDSMNVKSSLPPKRLSKEDSTIVNDVQNITNSVLDENPLHVSSSNISSKDNKLIATSNETDCDASTLHCVTSQKCSHGNLCTYVLIFASSLYFYHTVGAFE